MDIQKVTKLEELVSSFRAKYNEITNGETENVGVVLSLQVDCNEDNKVHAIVFASGTPGDQGLAVKHLDDQTGIVDTYVKCMALKSLKDLTGTLFGGKKRATDSSTSEQTKNEEQGE